jgi:type IV secretion system protein VirD4
MRLILNQIARRLTETLPPAGAATRRQLLLMLDEFPALGRLDFFESSMAFMAGYGIRAFLVAQSLHQIDRAYGHNHAILDNCHVRVAFAPNDERTAKRLSDALGTATELRAQTNLSGKRLSAWLSHTSISEQETPRALLTPGEVLQLPQNDALVQISGVPPIRARKLRYYADGNFLQRRLPAPRVGTAGFAAALPPRANDWLGQKRSVHERLEKAWSEMVSATGRAPELGPSLSDEVPHRPDHDRGLRADQFPAHAEGPQPPRLDDEEDDEIPR